MQCTRCGKEMFTSSTSSSDNYCFECQTNKPNTGRLSNCDMPFPSFGKQEGWICPVCGRGVSPWVDYCPCQSDWKITYGTSTGGDYDIKEYLDYMENYNNKDKKL